MSSSLKRYCPTRAPKKCLLADQYFLVSPIITLHIPRTSLSSADILQLIQPTYYVLQALKQQIAALEEHVHHLELDNRKRVVSLKGGKDNLNRQTSTGYVFSLYGNEICSLCVNYY